MNTKLSEDQRIELALHWEEEACIQALGDDDIVELDRIVHRAQSLLAYRAAHGWRAKAPPPTTATLRIGTGEPSHERVGP